MGRLAALRRDPDAGRTWQDEGCGTSRIWHGEGSEVGPELLLKHFAANGRFEALLPMFCDAANVDLGGRDQDRRKAFNRGRGQILQ